MPKLWTVQGFWAKVEVRGPQQCWLWTGAKNQKGYGRSWDGRVKRTRPAHVIAYEISWGCQINDKGLHHCDVPACCNPAHVFNGTTQDNSDDAKMKGRKTGATKLLSVNWVRNFAKRNSHLMQKQMAQKLGISESTICRYLKLYESEKLRKI